jgi:hypothetical protein
MKAQVVGLKETLRDLNKLDKELSKEIRKDIRKVVQPLADAITASVPAQAPLSGMAHSGRTGWQNRKKVAVKLDTRQAPPLPRPARPHSHQRCPSYHQGRPDSDHRHGWQGWR